MTRTTIETHPTGTFFDFADPRPEDVHIEDIARSLSMQCRFGGFVSRFYSVAEHALLVARLVREGGHGPELQFAALHHDSHEAYVGDIPTPLKNLLKQLAPGVYEELVGKIDEAIARRYEVLMPMNYGAEIIHEADAMAMRIEAQVLKVSRGVGEHWPASHQPNIIMPHGAVARYNEPAWAEHMFRAAHYRLSGDVAVARLGLAS